MEIPFCFVVLRIDISTISKLIFDFAQFHMLPCNTCIIKLKERLGISIYKKKSFLLFLKL